MGERLFRKLETGHAVAFASADAESWGFPRPVTPIELSEADWFRMGESVVFWFEHYPISSTWFVHLAVEPSARGKWGVRRWLRWIEQYAHDQGASEIGFVRCEGAEASEGYLRRLGWEDTSFGLARAV